MSNRRESAQPFNIKSLYDGKITQNEGQSILINSRNQQQIFFVKIYGVITVKKTDSTNGNKVNQSILMLLDDGTGSVWMKITADIIGKLKIWDFVRVIGIISIEKIDNNSNNIILYPEAIIPVKDKIWDLIHLLECDRANNLEIPNVNYREEKSIRSPKFDGSSFQFPSDSNNQSTKQINNNNQSENKNNESGESLTDKIEKILKEIDLGEGVEFNQLMKALGDSHDESVVDDILFELAYEGKVYQPRPEFYKLMD